LAERHTTGVGLAFHFAGPPGTGKTICAEALAYALNQKLLVVRYAELESRWVGQTSKHVASVFRAAAREDAVLFFDEADAIAGRRFTSVGAAYEREANAIVNVLLHELETFPGVVIFATNLAANIDPAFERRIRTHILFTMPDVEERERIWQVQLHARKTPLAEDVDFRALAQKYPRSGGDIKNAVLKAAQLATLEPGPDEAKRIHQRHFEQGMREGALGVSSSLQYIPNIYSTTEELTALSEVAARYGGAYFTHQRSESSRIDESLDEVFRIARDAKVRAQVWHLKTAYKPNWGRMREILGKIEAARAAGIDVSANQYPYNRASNGLDACLPPWVREGGRESLLKRLSDPATRERVKTDMSRDTTEWENQYLGSGGPEGVMVGSVLSDALKKYEGRTIASIAADEKKDARDALLDLVIADRANASCIISIMDENDVRAALAHPLVSFCTDSPAKATDGPFSREGSHPRGWGSAARILGHYVRDEKVLSLEEAIRKMTSFAAASAGIPDRGILRPGFAADLAVFDPKTVRDVATFESPNRYSEGFRYVAVNGVLVIDEGKLTGKKPGRAIRGPGFGSKSPVRSSRSGSVAHRSLELAAAHAGKPVTD